MMFVWRMCGNGADGLVEVGELIGAPSASSGSNGRTT